MLNFNVVVRKKRKDKHGLSNVEISVYQAGKTLYFLTGFKLKSNQFRSGLVVNHSASEEINTAIQLQLAGYISNSIRCNVDLGGMKAEAVRRILSGHHSEGVKFSDIIDEKIQACKEAGSVKSAQLYQYTRNTVKNFTDSVNIQEIDLKFLNSLSSHLANSGLKINTISLIFRYIRSVFNYAISRNLIDASVYPFRKFKIKSEKTAKRSLTIDELRKLFTLRGVHHESVHLDIFFLSFFLIGINIKDLLFAKKEQLVDGRLVYNRKKTGKLYSVKVLESARKIIEKYPGQVLLLNFMESRKRLDQFNKYLNKHLKKSALEAGINKEITTYFARHSWATIAANVGVSRDTISLALGHGLNTVTDVYIDFDLNKVDDVNELVCQQLKN